MKADAKIAHGFLDLFDRIFPIRTHVPRLFHLQANKKAAWLAAFFYKYVYMTGLSMFFFKRLKPFFL